MQDLVAEVLHEVDLSGTFESLVNSVDEEVEQKAELTATIMREEESRRLVEDLMAKRSQIHEEKEQKVIKLDETIAQLKDQLQETKARVALEGKYIKKESDVRVAVSSKTTGQKITTETKTADELRRLTAEEIKCHEEVVAFLDDNYSHLEESFNYWTTKNETEVDTKQQDLESLKANRARDLDTLTRKTEEYVPRIARRPFMYRTLLGRTGRVLNWKHAARFRSRCMFSWYLFMLTCVNLIHFPIRFVVLGTRSTKKCASQTGRGGTGNESKRSKQCETWRRPSRSRRGGGACWSATS